MKVHEKNVLDNSAALSTVPCIYSKGHDFTSKGAAVSLRELTVMVDDEMNELRCDQSPSFWHFPV